MLCQLKFIFIPYKRPTLTRGYSPIPHLKTLYFLADGLGSTIGLLTYDGRISARYSYDEFGIVQSSKKFDINWPGPDNMYGYTGLEYEYYSDLNYARARYYKAEIGRFISEDSYLGDVLNPQTQNLYAYVHNNPLRYIDPSGHWAVEIRENWHINEMKWGWSKAQSAGDTEKMRYWSTEAELTRERLRKKGIPESDIMQASDIALYLKRPLC